MTARHAASTVVDKRNTHPRGHWNAILSNKINLRPSAPTVRDGHNAYAHSCLQYVSSPRVVRSASRIDVVTGLAAVWAISAAIRALRKQSRTTKLREPKGSSLLFGVSKESFKSPDTGSMFEAWPKEYSVAYEVPTFLGQKRIILCDPKAVAYLFSRDTRSYVGTPGHKAAVARTEMGFFGLKASHTEGIVPPAITLRHKSTPDYPTPRRRRTMAPPLNPAAVRNSSSAIRKTLDKLKVAWQAKIDANGSGSVILDVQKCLDASEIAGFSYDFGSLDGTPNPLISALDGFAAHSPQSFWDKSVLFLSNFFPFALSVPTSRGKMLDELRARTSEICEILIDDASKEQEEASNQRVSTIGSLCTLPQSCTPSLMCVANVSLERKSWRRRDL
ncbi:hypothetical protein PISMIDRAFT_19305 [Pisolithus microcarpus 441]|uniref:Uncharacterized protein n=1 Tax=Pisolithus microcarpus 441 TaxID=765257 RepID=A0A0C9YUX3_9AGAM|nr:hypothetical protein BKA83DRAFT_19305 [Pisolithus microcarpus]KIK11703.1 hypothetical protein PISMIDRAFT_19305 [Pisolithus microcarpus 441]